MIITAEGPKKQPCWPEPRTRFSARTSRGDGGGPPNVPHHRVADLDALEILARPSSAFAFGRRVDGAVLSAQVAHIVGNPGKHHTHQLEADRFKQAEQPSRMRDTEVVLSWSSAEDGAQFGTYSARANAAGTGV
jgi:hypothetical protein